MKRTFIGIKIEAGEGFLTQLVDIRQRLAREKINWIPPERFHITLHFIGKSSDQLIADLNEALGTLIPNFPRQEIRIARLGVFPNVRKAKVLWADLEYGASLLVLQQAVVKIMNQHGQPTELRTFKPHLTLGRLKYPPQPERLAQVLEHFSHTVFEEQVLEGVTFFESQLDQSGPCYIPLFTYPFNGAILSRISG